MVKRQEPSNTSSKSRLRIWLVAGASSVALLAVMLTVATRTVQANAMHGRPSAVVPPSGAAITDQTPASLAPQQSAAPKRTDVLHGIASWYGKVFHGRKTASGERFNMYALTACHPTLPFGSVVRVVNLDNRKTVVVRITDRGDLVEEGRIIDLSFAAAQKLAMTKEGLAHVDVQVLKLGRDNSQN
jgi:rare lipoprotein A